MPTAFESYFSSYICYKGYHLGRTLWELLPNGPLDHVEYNSQPTDHCVTLNLEDRMLRKFPGYNGGRTNIPQSAMHKYVLCLFFVDGKLLNRIEKNIGFLMGLE